MTIRLGILASILLCFAALVPAAQADSISVGSKTIQPVDSFARVEDWFGRPAIEIYLFSHSLSEDQKEKIAQKRYPNSADIKTIAGDDFSVMQLLLFFDKGTRTCDGDHLVSYTAVFQKNDNFPIDVTTKGPVNWSFNRTPNAPLSEIGIAKLSCSFEPGGTVSVQVKNQWNVTGSDAAQILPAGNSSLLFSWDINSTNKVIVPK